MPASGPLRCDQCERCSGFEHERRAEARRPSPFLALEVAAAEPATAAARTPATAAATGTRCALVGLADVDLTATEIPAVQLGDGLAGLVRRAHLDESEAPRAAAVAVADDGRRLDGSSRREERLELFSGGGKREVSYEDFLAHDNSLPLTGALMVWSAVAWARGRDRR